MAKRKGTLPVPGSNTNKEKESPADATGEQGKAKEAETTAETKPDEVQAQGNPGNPAPDNGTDPAAEKTVDPKGASSSEDVAEKVAETAAEQTAEALKTISPDADAGGQMKEVGGSAPVSPWARIESLSDNEMSIEGVNVSAFQRSALLLRVRVDGKLTGQVIFAERLYYNPHEGTIKSR